MHFLHIYLNRKFRLPVWYLYGILRNIRGYKMSFKKLLTYAHILCSTTELLNNN